MVPTRRLAAVAALVAVVLLFFPGDLPGGVAWSLLAVNSVLVAIALLDGLAAVRPRMLEVERRHPPVIITGATGTLSWVVTNTTERRIRFWISDELAPSLHLQTTRVSGVVNPGGTTTIETGFRPERRGRFALSGLTVRTRGPLGLALRQRRRACGSVLRVHPPFRSRDEAELRIRRARILEVGLRSARGLGSGTEFEQLREYGPDDEFRRIDWNASVRHGRTIVRTYRPERNQTVIVLLDNGRTMAANVEGVARVEHAMDAAIMLGHVATRLGDRIGLITFDTHTRAVLPPMARTEQVARMTEAMFDLEPVLSASDYRGAFAEMLRRFRRRSLIVILSDLDIGLSETLVPALPMLLQRHLVIVAAVNDPSVARWALETAEDAEQVYRSASAAAASQDRLRTAAVLRGLGVTVIDAEPGKLAGDLADSYLSIKSAGRL